LIRESDEYNEDTQGERMDLKINPNLKETKRLIND
jgi:hypothetical protein